MLCNAQHVHHFCDKCKQGLIAHDYFARIKYFIKIILVPTFIGQIHKSNAIVVN